MVESDSISDNEIIDEFIESLLKEKGIETIYNCRLDNNEPQPTIYDHQHNLINYDYLCLTLNDHHEYPYTKFTNTNTTSYEYKQSSLNTDSKQTIPFSLSNYDNVYIACPPKPIKLWSTDL